VEVTRALAELVELVKFLTHLRLKKDEIRSPNKLIKVVSEMELRDQIRTQHDEQKHELTHHRSTMDNSQHEVQDLEQFHHTSLWLRIMTGGVFGSASHSLDDHPMSLSIVKDYNQW
jgi:hypothetical protein